MNGRIWYLTIPAGALALLLAGLSVFHVGPRQQAVLIGAGGGMDGSFAPGLHFKAPIVSRVSTYDARVLGSDLKSEQYLTSDDQDIMVDAFATWRIDDAGLFYSRLGGDAMQADLHIRRLLRNALAAEIAGMSLARLAAADSQALTAAMPADLLAEARAMGVGVLEIGVTRLHLSTAAMEAIYQHMRADSERKARALRAEGEQQSAILTADAERQRQVLLAEARRDAERIRGRGDAEAVSILAAGYATDPQFFDFYQNLQTYQALFAGQGNTLVVQPDIGVFKSYRHGR